MPPKRKEKKLQPQDIEKAKRKEEREREMERIKLLAKQIDEENKKIKKKYNKAKVKTTTSFVVPTQNYDSSGQFDGVLGEGKKAGGISLSDVKETAKRWGTKLLKIGVPLASVIGLMALGAKYKYNQWQNKFTRRARDQAEEQAEIEKQQRNERMKRQKMKDFEDAVDDIHAWKRIPHEKPSAQPYFGDGLDDYRLRKDNNDKLPKKDKKPPKPRKSPPPKRPNAPTPDKAKR